MLQHEQTDPPVSPTVPPPIPNAAEARVTPDELNAALKALEDRQNSTVAIGSVVDELRLNATPEQIWEQVQRQREQKQVTKPAAVMAASAPARRRLRTWREVKGWAWVLFWCSGGLVWATLSPLLHHHAVSSRAITISGQAATQTGNAQGKDVVISGDSVNEEVNAQGKDVVISGNDDKIMLHGKARSLSVDGNSDTITAASADTAFIDGKGDTVKWTGTPPSGSGLIDSPHR